MARAQAPGTYALDLPDAVPGVIQVDLTAATTRKGTPVVSRAEHWTATLEPGRTIRLASARVDTSGSGDSAWAIAAFLATGLAALAVTGVRSRRSSLPTAD